MGRHHHSRKKKEQAGTVSRSRVNPQHTLHTAVADHLYRRHRIVHRQDRNTAGRGGGGGVLVTKKMPYLVCQQKSRQNIICSATNDLVGTPTVTVPG